MWDSTINQRDNNIKQSTHIIYSSSEYSSSSDSLALLSSELNSKPLARTSSSSSSSTSDSDSLTSEASSAHSASLAETNFPEAKE